jgi:hypothetical protein
MCSRGNNQTAWWRCVGALTLLLWFSVGTYCSLHCAGLASRVEAPKKCCSKREASHSSVPSEKGKNDSACFALKRGVVHEVGPALLIKPADVDSKIVDFDSSSLAERDSYIFGLTHDPLGVQDSHLPGEVCLASIKGRAPPSV